MIDRPHITVAAVIERDGRFLLVEEQSGGRTVYNQPAGHLESGENLVEAVIRETREETAWHFQPLALSGIYQWTNPENQIGYLRFCFTGTCHDHDPDQSLDTGIIRTWWLTRDDIMARAHQHRSPLVMRCIDDYHAGKRYPLELYTDISTA